MRFLKKELTKQFSNHCLRSFSLNTWLSSNAQAIKSIASVVGEEKVAVSQAWREQHDHDESVHSGHLPAAVVWPSNVKEVSEVMKICNKSKIPVIPYGTGSGLEGGVVPLNDKTICINLQNMDKIREVDVDNLCAEVEPGVTRVSLNEHLKTTGLWFPIDPGADASVCGMAATGASGTNAVRYGTMKQNVLNIEVVLPNGDILYTSGEGQKCLKRSSGYNLTELFVGSEGTLGVITSVLTKLHGLPESILSGVCPFPNVESAVQTAIQIKQYGIPVARMELVDRKSIEEVQKQNDINFSIADSLFFEFHGSEQSTQEQVEIVNEIASGNGAKEMQWAEKLEERNKLWKARHDMYYTAKRMKANHVVVITDVCVPISKLPNILSYTDSLLNENSIPYMVVGHIGDGNFHTMMVVDPDNKTEMSRIKEAGWQMARKAIELGGTCTGEHGVGIGKKHLLLDECGHVGLDLMKNIKSVIDPNSIMNPGKLL